MGTSSALHDQRIFAFSAQRTGPRSGRCANRLASPNQCPDRTKRMEKFRDNLTAVVGK
jgi:hypothetical protein